MNYHRKDKNKINKKIVILIIVLLLLFSFSSFVKGTVNLVTVPVLKIKDLVYYPFEFVFGQFKFKDDLINVNKELKKENRRLEIENLTVESLRIENESLRQQVNYVKEDDKFITAKVLSQPPFSPYDTFIIDVGSNDVTVGDPVYYLGVLIGSIEESHSYNSIVRLKSSPEQTFFVTVADQNVEARGIGSGGFVLLLPKDFFVEPGQVIFVESNPIGQIDNIENDETGAFINVYFRFPFNINSVDFVQVYKIQR